MKYYIIYKDNEFIGYTDNKELLKDFLKNRKGSYKIDKCKDEEIIQKIQKSFEFSDYELIRHNGYYYTDYKIPMFNYENIAMEKSILEDALIIQELLQSLIDLLVFVRLSKEEKELITYGFNKLIQKLDDITNSNEIFFDEHFNIDKYFYKKYLIEIEEKDVYS